jgi:hypothetical protein
MEDLVYDWMSASMLASRIQEDKVSVVLKLSEGVSSCLASASASSSL